MDPAVFAIRPGRSFRRVVCTLLGMVIVSGVLSMEVYHRLARGHFAPIGLHVDVFWADAAIGGPELSRMYWPVITNFGLWPATLDVCNYLTDTAYPGSDYPVALQRWDPGLMQWEAADFVSLEEICPIPMPTSRGAGTLAASRLWPGSSVEASGPEAIGARGDFEDGDLARFVVLRTASRSPDWGKALASESFGCQR